MSRVTKLGGREPIWRPILVPVAIGSLVAIAIVLALFGFNYKIILNNEDSFIVSVVGSAVEDIGFFLLIGLAVFLAGLRDPKEDSFEARIRYLFSGDDTPSDIVAHNAAEIEKLGCASTLVSREIVVTEYREDIHCYKLYINTVYRIRNYFTNHPVEVEIGPSITPEQSDVELKPLGEFLHLVASSDRGLAFPNLSGPIPIQREGFNQEIRINLPPDSEIEYLSAFWLWNKVGEDHFFAPKRYTRRFKSTVENRIDTDVLIKKDGYDELLRIRPGEIVTVIDKFGLSANSYVRLWWCNADGSHVDVEQMAVI